MKTEITRLAELNRIYFTRSRAGRRGARQSSWKRRSTRSSGIAFRCSTILRAQVEDAVIVRAEAAWSAQLVRLAVDLRTKDFSATKLEDLLDQYKLAVLP